MERWLNYILLCNIFILLIGNACLTGKFNSLIKEYGKGMWYVYPPKDGEPDHVGWSGKLFATLYVLMS
jgi:hypothetical protein